MQRSFSEMWVVMGAGLAVNGQLSPVALERCKWVARSEPRGDCLLLASSSFTLNVPPKLNGEGFPVSEASAMWRVLKELCPENIVLCEQQSHDSVGSVLFSLFMYAEPLGIGTVRFVTSDFHASRVRVISNFVRKIVCAVDVQTSVDEVPTSLHVQSRMRHEAAAAARFEEEYCAVRTRKEFFGHFWSQHSVYNHNFMGRTLVDDSTY